MGKQETIYGKFDLPNAWKNTTIYSFTKIEQPLSTPRLVGSGVNAQPTRASITISQLDATKESLDDVLARQLAGVAGQLPDFELVASDKQGELVSYEIRFAGRDNRKLRQRTEHLPWKNGNKFTVVTLTATDDTFDRFRSTLAAVVASFEQPEQQQAIEEGSSQALSEK